MARISAEEFDKQAYQEELEARLGMSYSVMRGVFNQVKNKGKRIVFPEGDNEKVIRAAAQLVEQGICKPILLGKEKVIQETMEHLGISFPYVVFNPRDDPRRKGIYAEQLFEKRKRKGMTISDAQRLLKSRPYFAAQMVEAGDADGYVGGVSRNYGDVLRPCIELIGPRVADQNIIGCYMMVIKGKLIFSDESGFQQLKRTWKLNRGITKEANSFHPKKLIKDNLEELPKLNDVINYLLEIKLIKFETSENE